jgi:hypothetical protein
VSLCPQFLVGALPLFMAFVTFGMIVFGIRAARFSSWSATFVELFAVRHACCALRVQLSLPSLSMRLGRCLRSPLHR